MRTLTIIAASTIAFATSTASFAKPTLVSEVYGQDVYDQADNKIGKVDDLQFNDAGTIVTAIIGVGGFLGIGEKDVSIPFATMKWTTKDNKTWLVLDQSKDQLKAAPAVDKMGNPK